MAPMREGSVDLFRQMLRIRMVEETIADRYAEQEMRCPVHLCIGQEAVAVGACADLGPQDYVLSAHRSHGHYLARGGDLKAMIAELYGKDTGCCSGYGGSMHLIDLSVGFLGAVPIVGSTIPIAVGAAFGSLLRDEQRVALVFFGDGATEEGVFHESVNFALLWNLPVLFVCENNQYSVYSPLSVRQHSGRRLCDVPAGHGMPTEQGNGNDLDEVRRKVSAALSRARAGGGPSFLEFETFRWREHCGPNFDDDLGYRPDGDLETWQQRCPIQRQESSLREGGQLDERGAQQMRQELQLEIDEAFTFAKESPFPSRASLTDNIYAPPTGA